jgi:hypothetical protein
MGTLQSGGPTTLPYNPGAEDSGKAAIIKGIRIVNTSTTADAVVTVTFGTVGGTAFKVFPPGMKIPPSSLVVDSEELTACERGELKITLDSGGPIDCVISGMERE